jgi:hypothetical protein
MCNPVRNCLAALAALAALAIAAAPPAGATLIEKGRFVDEPYGFAYNCGFPVEVTGVATGNFRLRAGSGNDATAFFALDRISFREIHTNPETGEWFALTGHFLSNEFSATRVEGSLFEFRSIKAGSMAVIRDSDGNLVSRNRGVLKRTILFDTGGDDEPGGEFVELIDVRLAGKHPDFDRLCDVATQLIG